MFLFKYYFKYKHLLKCQDLDLILYISFIGEKTHLFNDYQQGRYIIVL